MLLPWVGIFFQALCYSGFLLALFADYTPGVDTVLF